MPDKVLAGQVVVVTGAGQGMGRAHALASARAGADVVGIDRLARSHPDMLETGRLIEDAGQRALMLSADITNNTAIEAAAHETHATFGEVHSLVLNAGVFAVQSLLDGDDSIWARMIDVNLLGAVRTIRAFVPDMLSGGTGGSIVFIASVNGVEPQIGYAAYSTSKFAVIGLMKNAAVELAEHGIRCNAILPGIVDTPMAASVRSGRPQAEIDAARRRNFALKGMSVLQPEDIAQAAVYLNSPLASAITGVELAVDGGHLVLPGVNTRV